MSDLVLLLVTGLGLGALYVPAASGLSLIYGLMGVLNFAHGVFMTAGAYAGWLPMGALPSSWPVPMRLAKAVVLYAGLVALRHLTRLGLVIRAGVENRTMVEALAINVHRTFTIVFTIGGAAAGLAGPLYSQYAGAVSPGQGGSLLIYAFIVVVIGGMGPLTGSAVAAVVVGLAQLANYYAASGVGDLSVVLLLALVLLLRPTSLNGATT